MEISFNEKRFTFVKAAADVTLQVRNLAWEALQGDLKEYAEIY